MDILGRLSKVIGGSPAATAPNTQPANAALPPQSPTSRTTPSSGRRRAEARSDSTRGVAVFKDNWRAIQSLLLTPDQAALHHGISRTDLVIRLQDLSDTLVSEANRADEDNDIAGPCMEALLEGDLLGRLVKLTANDRVAGSQAEVVKLFASLIILLDERFLSRQAVHRPLVRLMRICVGDEFFNTRNQAAESDNEDEEVKAWRRFGRDGSAEVLGFEEDLVDMMCHVASRLRNTPELLIIFFRDRGGDAEAKRAFNRALMGAHSPISTPGSRSSTRPTSPAGSSTTSAATIKATMPNISSPLRPQETFPGVASRKDIDSASSASTSTSLTYDFPLFSYLLRFVHRESRTGELARAGLLFLVDVAFAPGRRNLSRARRREGAASRGQPDRGGRGGSIKRGGANASARIRIDVDFGLGPSLALSRYMVESDFAEVLGASLGAVYGLLPGKVAASRQSATREGQDESSGMSLGGSILPNVEAETLHQRGIALNTSEEVRKQARLLSDLLEFTQDILRTTSRMPSETPDTDDKKRTYVELIQVAQSLTASIGLSIQKLYLESILYPSLLECSDMDGSAVAVMTYLDLMLSVLENDGVLADFIVGWLIGEEGETSEIDTAKKHKSTAMLQLEREKGKQKEVPGYFTDVLVRYTVKDLLLDHLKTTVKPEAIIAALNLASTIVVFYGQYSLRNVLQVTADDLATSFPSTLLPSMYRGEGDNSADDDSGEFVYPGGSKEDELFEERLQVMKQKAVGSVHIAQHSREMGLYLSLATLMVQKGTGEALKDSPTSSGFQSSSTGFDNYLEDAEQSFIRDSMFWDGLCSLEGEDDNERQSRHSFRHRLMCNDPLLRALLGNLCHFWQNPPEVNVALTGLIADLAICPLRSLEGFIVFERDSEAGGQDEAPGQGSNEASPIEEGDDRSDDEKTFARASKQASKKTKSGRGLSSDGSAASPPIVLCILRSLVTTLDHYRPEVHDFDRLLRERRKGLLFVENLSEALQGVDTNGAGQQEVNSRLFRYEPSEVSQKKLWAGIKVDAEVVETHLPRNSSSRTKQISLPPPPSAVMIEHKDDTPAPVQKREGFARFFGRSVSAKATTTTETPAEVQTANSNPQPFAQHYHETSSLYLGMDRLRISSRSKWSSEYKAVEEKSQKQEKRTRFKEVDGDSDEENVLYPGVEEVEEKEREKERASRSGPDLVNLSSLLDNAVVLEEFLKQLAAILQIRRANGVDGVSFV